MCEYHLTYFACHQHLTNHGFKGVTPVGDPYDEYPDCGGPEYKEAKLFVDEVCPACKARDVEVGAAGYGGVKGSSDNGKEKKVGEEVEAEYQRIMRLRDERLGRGAAAAASGDDDDDDDEEEEEEEEEQDEVDGEAVAAVNRSTVNLDFFAAANGHVSSTDQGVATWLEGVPEGSYEAGWAVVEDITETVGGHLEDIEGVTDEAEDSEVKEEEEE
jgi:hypothetical protein